MLLCYCYSVTIILRTYETLPALYQLTFFSTIFSAALFLKKAVYAYIFVLTFFNFSKKDRYEISPL